jgi:hypothetical protein
MAYSQLMTILLLLLEDEGEINTETGFMESVPEKARNAVETNVTYTVALITPL